MQKNRSSATSFSVTSRKTCQLLCSVLKWAEQERSWEDLEEFRYCVQDRNLLHGLSHACLMQVRTCTLRLRPGLG